MAKFEEARSNAKDSLVYWLDQADEAYRKAQPERRAHCLEYVSHYENDVRYWNDFERRYPEPSVLKSRFEPPKLKFSEIVWFPYYCAFLVIHTAMITFGWLALGTLVFAFMYAMFGA